MRLSSNGLLRYQVDTLYRPFLQDGGLLFADVLSVDCLLGAFRKIKAEWWKDRIFTPLVTLWVFLGQVLNADHSSRTAVVWMITEVRVGPPY